MPSGAGLRAHLAPGSAPASPATRRSGPQHPSPCWTSGARQAGLRQVDNASMAKFTGRPCIPPGASPRPPTPPCPYRWALVGASSPEPRAPDISGARPAPAPLRGSAPAPRRGPHPLTTPRLRAPARAWCPAARPQPRPCSPRPRGVRCCAVLCCAAAQWHSAGRSPPGLVLGLKAREVSVESATTAPASAPGGAPHGLASRPLSGRGPALPTPLSGRVLAGP